MMTGKQIDSTLRIVRIVLGIVLIAIGVYTGIYWFYLGVLPLIAGIMNWCPICKITKKCDVN
jgi:hypothetical protein